VISRAKRYMQKKLSLIHPSTQQPMSWEVELPDDFEELLDELRYDAEIHGGVDY